MSLMTMAALSISAVLAAIFIATRKLNTIERKHPLDGIIVKRSNMFQNLANRASCGLRTAKRNGVTPQPEASAEYQLA